MTVLDTFMEDLAASPADWTLRGVFADWAEDNGLFSLAECLRWMAAHRKRPYRGTSAASWFNADTISPHLGDPESDIPGCLYRNLEGGKEKANHKTFASMRQAEEAVHQAWNRARADGWKP